MPDARRELAHSNDGAQMRNRLQIARVVPTEITLPLTRDQFGHCVRPVAAADRFEPPVLRELDVPKAVVPTLERVTHAAGRAGNRAQFRAGKALASRQSVRPAWHFARSRQTADISGELGCRPVARFATGQLFEMHCALQSVRGLRTLEFYCTERLSSSRSGELRDGT